MLDQHYFFITTCVEKRTDKRTLHGHVEKFTQDGATCYSNEWQGYHGLGR